MVDAGAREAKPPEGRREHRSASFGITRDQALIFVAVTFAAYALFYIYAKFLPGDPAQPLGWWGWADQGQYLKSARAFADGSWRRVDHFYPPVYPWLGSWFIRAAPGHPFFVIDYLGFALHVGALLIVGRSLCGPCLAIAAVAATMAFFPDLTMQHWAEPWTTSVSTGLGSILILAVWHFDGNGWRLERLRDWGVLLCASFALGTIAALRPLDAMVYLPLTGFLFARVGWTLVRASTWTRACYAAIAVLLAGSIVPALFVSFNLQTSGTIVGSYIVRSQAVGYELGDFARKFVSLLFDSTTVYAEPKQTITARFWPLLVALPASFGLLLWSRLSIRFLALTVLLQLLVYLPYADLTPTSLYRYANVHYFKWIFPWLVLLTVAQLRIWVGGWRGGRAVTGMQIGVVAAGTLCASALTLAVRTVIPVAITKETSHDLLVELAEERTIDFVDLPGVTGGLDAVFNTVDTLDADGVSLRWLAEFRLLPISDGARLVFGRPRRVHRLRLTLDPAVSTETVQREGRAVAVGYSLTCWVTRCPAADMLTQDPAQR